MQQAIFYQEEQGINSKNIMFY